MFSNFTEETCTGTGNTLALAGATAGKLPFSLSFTDGDPVAYAVEDSGGIIKVAGVGTYVSATDDITRNDTWNYNGTVIDKNPSTNITLSGGTHTVRCELVSRNISSQSRVDTWLESSSYKDLGDNLSADGFVNDVVTADRCTYCAIQLHRPRLLTNLTVYVSTADAVATISKAGLYKCGSDGKPTDLIESVTIDVATTGYKTVALSSPLFLEAGWYYTAFASDGAPQVTACAINGVMAAPLGIRPDVPRRYNPYETLTAWSDLPATATPVMGENYAPIVFWD
jgi:hypothetical protein